MAQNGTWTRRLNIYINGKEVRNDIASIRGELRKLENQQTHANIGSKKYNELGSEIRRVKAILAEHREGMKFTNTEQEKMSGSGSRLSGIFGKLFGSVGSLVGGLTIAAGAMGLLRSVFSATDTITDKLDIAVGGLRTGFQYLAKSIASLDFDNFLSNMWNAIKAGREYARVMDDVMDRTRSLQILESKDKQRLAQLDILSKDVNLPLKQRIAAAKESLEIEKNNAERRIKLAKDTEAAELNNASIMTGLSKERIKELLEIKESQKGLTAEVERYMDAQAEFSSFGSDKESISKAKQTLNGVSEVVRNTARDFEKFGKLTDEEKDKLSTVIVAVGEASAYYDETTKRVQTRMAKLTKGIIDEEEKITEHTSIAKNAMELLQDSIKNKENDLWQAVFSKDPALVKKISLELAALRELEKTYQRTYNQILSGFDVQDIVASMTPKSAGVVTKNKPPELTDKDLMAIDVLNSDQDKHQFQLDQIKQFNEEQFELQKQADEAELTAFQEKERTKRDIMFDLAKEANDAIFQIIGQRIDSEKEKELSKIENLRKQELAQEGLTQTEIENINNRFNERAKKAKEDAWRKQHKADLLRATASGALAVLNALAYGNIAAVPMAIAAGVASAIEIGVIASQEMPEFSKGGYTSTGNSGRPAGVIHENEYVIPSSGLRNQHLSPFINIIEMARLNGNLASINPSLHGLSLSDSQYQRSVFNAQYSTEKMGLDTEIINANTIVLEALLHKLSQPLNVAPVEATVSLLGRNGILENTEKYENMKGKSSL